ncbi:hypothetical protein WJX72_007108 [[Myrmecia] bisecta]|uniref:Peptidase M14 domain-containing protein n=1 Tax=[Myrmecia] bisecta TaxID=41462 RepID=A0AAW1PPD9_9CHLO
MTIDINAVFDSGNIEVVDARDHRNLQLKIRPDPYTPRDKTAHFQWFHYRVSNAHNMPLTMIITNANESSFPVAWPGYKCCASYDTIRWFRVDTKYDQKRGTITIKHTPEQDSTYFSYFAPYTYSRHRELVARMQGKSCVRLEVVGNTVEGRSMDLLIIGAPESRKHRIWIVARQHPGESMAEWFMEGFLENLTDEHSAFARRTLQHAVFYVVPNMNPDGSLRGHLRTNAKGANLNREWANPTLGYSPEVYHVLNKMDKTGADLFLDIHGDEEIPFNFLAGQEGIPSFDNRLKQLAKTFMEAFERATPDFQAKPGYDVDEPGQADLSIASNAVGERFHCLAFTLEMPFKDTEDSPDAVYGWSPERAKRFGACILNPIYETLPDLKDNPEAEGNARKRPKP